MQKEIKAVAMKRKIGVVTVSRSGYATLKPLFIEIIKNEHLELHLYVTGMHLSQEYGYTINNIINDNIPIFKKVDMLLADNSPVGIAKSMGLATIHFAQIFDEDRPDILIIFGDRFEQHAVAVASIPYKIPIVHLRGGELTSGAIDESFRHSISKMSHLHFVANQEFKKRLEQMGEQSWRIKVVGDPALERIEEIKVKTRKQLQDKFIVDFSKKFFLITYHPVTLEFEKTERQINELLKALSSFKMYNLIFTYPNADTYGSLIISKIKTFCQLHNNAYIVPNFGSQYYYSVLHHAEVMIGNSSSGIWESPSFRLAVVNIGNRQDGRTAAKNIINTGYKSLQIKKGITKALSKEFKKSLHNIINPYYKKNSIFKMITTLLSIKINQKLLFKKFQDIK